MLLSFDVVGQDGEMRLANAKSVYHEILKSLNQEGTYFIAPAPQRKPQSLASIKKQETQSFVEEIRFEIQESIQFPHSLKGTGYQATVVVEFALNFDGTVRDVKARIRSGRSIRAFELGAIDAVKRASEFFPLIPKQVNVQKLKFKIPIIFQETV